MKHTVTIKDFYRLIPNSIKFVLYQHLYQKYEHNCRNTAIIYLLSYLLSIYTCVYISLCVSFYLSQFSIVSSCPFLSQYDPSASFIFLCFLNLQICSPFPFLSRLALYVFSTFTCLPYLSLLLCLLLPPPISMWVALSTHPCPQFTQIPHSLDGISSCSNGLHLL